MIFINNLQHSNKTISQAIKNAIDKVVNKGQYICGPEVDAFENEFATFCGVNHCVSVANGTDALELALRSLQLSNEDHVATVANAGMYATTAILAIGATPIFIEIDPQTMTMDPSELEKNITNKTKAIIVTHLYGQMANITAIKNLALAKGIILIEDCAHAHGASIDGQKAGSWGDIGCFSFYPTKNLGALGDAGAITTNNSDLAARIKGLRQYGWQTKYDAVLPGGRNSRLDELQAAVLRVKLPYLEQWNSQRRSIANTYYHALKDYDVFVPNNFDNSYVAHLYVLRSKNRSMLQQHLKTNLIHSDIHYPLPDYQQKILVEKFINLKLAITEQCCHEILTLPCYPGMTNSEINHIIASVKEFQEQPCH